MCCAFLGEGVFKRMIGIYSFGYLFTILIGNEGVFALDGAPEVF